MTSVNLGIKQTSKQTSRNSVYDNVKHYAAKGMDKCTVRYDDWGELDHNWLRNTLLQELHDAGFWAVVDGAKQIICISWKEDKSNADTL